jgi:hexosaminidase
MITNKLIYALIIVCWSLIAFSQPTSIIPAPNSLLLKYGTFSINKSTDIEVNRKDTMIQNVVIRLNDAIKKQIGFHLKIFDNSSKTSNFIYLKIEKIDSLGKEGYNLNINSEHIKVTANTETGLLYGVQSLIQMFHWNGIISSTIDIKCCAITDAPRFAWRGLMLDVSRHFFQKEEIKKCLDLLALYKLNVFHWHLTDNEGWRIEIKKYPQLTGMGAWREARENLLDNRDRFDSNKRNYGGFYTQDEIKEIVQYASKLGITIIPEIDMPGHTMAVIDAYPELSCTGKPFIAPADGSWEMPDPFCIGNEKSFEFVENVLSEVIELFPSEYIHIGGDEVKKTPWEKCRKCQERMNNEKLENSSSLQSYFNRRIEKFLASKNRKLIGWDEILEGGLSPNATVMSWQNEQGGLKAIKLGNDVVMSPYNFLYFNKMQSNPSEDLYPDEGVLTMSDVYYYSPIATKINDDDMKHLLGVEACLWSEYVKTPDQLERRLLPRLAALAEIAWNKNETRNWEDFLRRVNHQYAIWDEFHYNYFIPAPEGIDSLMLFIDSISIEMVSPMFSGKIFYTLDGSEPTLSSSIYHQPLKINQSAILKARTYIPKTNSWSHTIVSKIEKSQPLPAYNFDYLTDNGIQYTVYKGNIFDCDHFEKQKVDSGTVVEFTDSIHTNLRDFSVRYSGLIKVPLEGVYAFSTFTDGHLKLIIDNNHYIENKGFFGGRKITKPVCLQSGIHKIEVQFYTDKPNYILNILLNAVNQ